MTSFNNVKKSAEITIAITGAAGQVSYALLFLLMNSNLFGKNTRLLLRLIDHSHFIKKLEGLRLELIDCAFSRLEDIEITSDFQLGFMNADWVIFNGGYHQERGMTKASFIQLNAKLIASQAKALNLCKIPEHTKFLMVANPVNVNCQILSHFSPKIPKKNIFGLSYLDYTRALSALAKKMCVAPDKIQNLFVWGNHSKTIYPHIGSCVINNRQIKITSSLNQWHKNQLVPLVQGRGEKIIKLRGHNSAGSAAKAILDAMRLLENKTPVRQTLSIVCCSNGEYGIKKNIWFSFPCKSVNKKIDVIKNLQLDTYTKKKIALSELEILDDLELAFLALKLRYRKSVAL